MNEMGLRSCSGCGKQVPREDMFGAEPDLLCEPCARGLRERLAPKATGRLENLLKGGTGVTIAIIAVAAGLFLFGRTWSGSSATWAPWTAYLTELPRIGGRYVPMVIVEPWRLLSSAFLHAGFFHILFNAMWIWTLARPIEMRRGSVALGALVVGSAVFASAVSWIFSGPGVGLSGVVYALAGYLFALRKHDPVAAMVMNPRTARFLGAWLVIGVVLSEIGSFPIGNWAHGGGLAWGLAAGFAQRSKHKMALWGLLAAATIAAVVVVTRGYITW